MKRTLSAILVLIMLLGCFSGLLVAADAAPEAPTIDSPTSAR